MEPSHSHFPLGRAVILIVLFSILTFMWIISPPKNFPINTPFLINEGDTVREAAENLKALGYIHSKLGLIIYDRIVYRGKGVISGVYVFENPISLFEITHKLVTKGGAAPSVRVTIPEGTDNEEIAELLSKRILNFDKIDFLMLASTSQGYLFPDTYFLSPYSSTASIVRVLRENFEDKIALIEKDIASSTKPLSQIILMAAIIEEEGKSLESRRMIADILWRRLETGMPLQVDVATSTYETQGFTKKPITNPGLESIQAVIDPIPNKYFYYLSDKKNVFHYSVTYDEHMDNIAKYLK